MTDRLHWFVGCACWLASLAYASKMKRAGHSHFTSAVGALYMASGDGVIVYGQGMPCAVTLASGPRATD
jgi:hypothetical protein